MGRSREARGRLRNRELVWLLATFPEPRGEPPVSLFGELNFFSHARSVRRRRPTVRLVRRAWRTQRAPGTLCQSSPTRANLARAVVSFCSTGFLCFSPVVRARELLYLKGGRFGGFEEREREIFPAKRPFWSNEPAPRRDIFVARAGMATVAPRPSARTKQCTR